jgi:hypothetical protein
MQIARPMTRRCSTVNIAGSKRLSDWEKRIMVWGGAFKNRAEVPAEVPHTQYQKCQERFRIKMNIYAIGLTLGACGIMIYLGQRDKEAGMTYHNQVMQRHAEAAAAAQSK